MKIPTDRIASHLTPSHRFEQAPTPSHHVIPKPYGASHLSELIDTRICNELLDVYS
jgi:hypothetical protein